MLCIDQTYHYYLICITINQDMKKHNCTQSALSTPIMTLLFTLCSLQHSPISLPFIKQPGVLELKLGQVYYFSIPSYGFQEIRERSVKSMVNGSKVPLDACWEVPPQISFHQTNEIIFEGISERPLLIYKFEDIQYSQNVLDAYFSDNKIYVFFQDGSAAYIEISKDLEIKEHKKLQYGHLQEDQRLEEGYFVGFGDQIVLFSENHAFKVSKNSIDELPGYQSSQMFESAVSINNQSAAVINRNSIIIYTFNGTNLIIADKYEVSNQSSQLFKDIVYYPKRRSLIIIDHHSGAIQLRLNYSETDIPKFNGQRLLILDQKYCQIAGINNQTQILHVVCQKLHDIDLTQWPIFSNTVQNDSPGVRVKDIYDYGPLTAYLGVDAFIIKYLDKQTTLYEDQNLDRLKFVENLYLSVNEDRLTIGTYLIQYPSFGCKFENLQNIGDHLFIFQTQAACSDTYITANVQAPYQLKLGEGNICLYSIEKQVHVWKPGSLMMREIQIGFVVFCAASILVVISLLIIKGKLERIRREYLTKHQATKCKDSDQSDNFDSGTGINRDSLEDYPPPYGSKHQLAESQVSPRNRFNINGIKNN